jgi:hypothetical protein
MPHDAIPRVCHGDEPPSSISGQEGKKKKRKNPRISSPLPPSGGDAVWGLKSSVQDMNTLTHAPALFNPTLPLNSLAACSMTTL